MSQQLRKVGCKTVHVCDNGLEALEFLSKTTFHNPSITEEKYTKTEVTAEPIPLSIILLDVEMPVLDGFATARRIRQLESSGDILSHVPIIAITANARPQQIADALEAGMDEVVTKPFRIPALIPRMKALVGSWQVDD